MSDMIQLNLPATGKYLNVLGASIAEFLQRGVREINDETIYNVQLAAHEACTNVIDHAYSGDTSQRMNITVELLPQSVIVTVKDTGVAFDPSQVVPPNLDVPQVRGYGLHLIKNLMDEVDYRREDTGNIWRLVKTL